VEQPQPKELAQGRYRLSGVLGRGGMATVYRAWDQLLEVHRAVKVLDLGVRSPAMRRRFLDEARMMAKLRHPNLVTVYDVGADQPAFMVMEILPGSLHGWLRRHGPMPPRLACRAVASVLGGLAHVHGQGIVHRDVKPHNVLVDEGGHPKLTDFGIARVGESSMTRTGSVMGTFAYMPPEQREDAKRVDFRADLYASGALLYALLTDREPLDLHATEGHPEAFRDVPPALVELIRQACRWAPEDRFESAAAMKEALEQLVEDLPEDPPGTPPLHDCLPSASGTVADDSWGSGGLPDTPQSPSATLTPSLGDTGAGTLDEAPSGLTEAELAAPPPRLPWVAGPALALAVAALLVWSPWSSTQEPGPAPLPRAVQQQPAVEPEVVEVEASAEPQPEVPAPVLVRPAPVPEPVVEDAVTQGSAPEPQMPEIVHGVINSVPGGTFSLDGSRPRPLPYRGDLPAGAHTLTLRSDDGRTHTLPVQLGPDFAVCWNYTLGRECP
jgi:serine/threonine protein kinase